jgi:hypothetical protein
VVKENLLPRPVSAILVDVQEDGTEIKPAILEELQRFNMDIEGSDHPYSAGGGLDESLRLKDNYLIEYANTNKWWRHTHAELFRERTGDMLVPEEAIYHVEALITYVPFRALGLYRTDDVRLGALFSTLNGPSRHFEVFLAARLHAGSDIGHPQFVLPAHLFLDGRDKVFVNPADVRCSCCLIPSFKGGEYFVNRCVYIIKPITRCLNELINDLTRFTDVNSLLLSVESFSLPCIVVHPVLLPVVGDIPEPQPLRGISRRRVY